jgi:hypothetical protein
LQGYPIDFSDPQFAAATGQNAPEFGGKNELKHNFGSCSSLAPGLRQKSLAANVQLF